MEIIETPKKQLPNATSSLVLGILSVIFSGLIGLILGIIGLCISSKGMKEYIDNPDSFYGYGQLNSGRILSIIGIAKNVITIVVLIIIFAIFGAAILASIGAALGTF
ncbi:MAG: CCC motif membrane protein [Bacteroidales bacterium]|jgi:type III secretory pathway component EscU